MHSGHHLEVDIDGLGPLVEGVALKGLLSNVDSGYVPAGLAEFKEALPLVSILIPTRNRRELLSSALASARGQTYSNLEIIVSDNASEDGSADLVEEISRSDPRVRCIRHDHDISGLPNFLEVLAEASGSYVKYLCDDDLLAPKAVERLVSPLLSDSGIVLSFSKRARIDIHGAVLPDDMSTQPLSPSDVVLDGIGLGDLTLTKLCNFVGEPSTVLFRRSALQGIAKPFSIKGVDFDHSTDWALWLNLLRQGSAYYCAETLSFFRVHLDQDQMRHGRHEEGLADLYRLAAAARGLGYLGKQADEMEGLGRLLLAMSAVLRQSGEHGCSPMWSAASGVAERLSEMTRAPLLAS